MLGAPARAYAAPPLARKVYDLYRQSEVSIEAKALQYRSKLELVEKARSGVRADTIKRLAELLNITQEKASEFFHFQLRTLRKYIKEGKLLDPDSSEKVLKMFSLYLYGSEVFEGSDNFVAWLHRPAYGMQNRVPVELLYSSDGIDLIYEEVARIEHGDLS